MPKKTKVSKILLTDQQKKMKEVAKKWKEYKKKHPNVKYQTYMKNNL